MLTCGRSCVFILALLASETVLAQAPVTGVVDPESLFTSADPTLHSNKQVALHIVRELLDANQWNEASKYIAPDYIQHNPNVPSGLDAVLRFFEGRPPRPVPASDQWQTKVVAVLAEDDLVVVAFAREHPDPRFPGKTYTTTWFDMWRIENGKAIEHWDPALVTKP